MSAEFVDTNVLVYGCDRSAGRKHEKAAALLNRLWEEETGCMSVQVLQEFFVVATRKIPRPLGPDRARGIIADFGAWRIHSPGVEDVLGAIDLAGRSRISFWDAMVVRSAAALSAGVLWSEDLQAGRKIAGVLVRNPFG
ncbi:MAG: PIN domain-containing protein [Deltaproteobacteria bacterium]|nr:PIN domain-containing protein [Deltaproteobacteria bacterium]